MRYSNTLVAVAMVAAANAHTTIWNMYIDDVDQGVGNTAGGYIRSPPNNNPVKDLTSSDLTCNVNNVAAEKTITVTAGSEITFEWHHDSNSASDDIIASSHKGPVMAYIAPTSSNGAGDVRVKLAEEGYDATTKLWAVDNLITNKGKHSFTIPSVLADGDYLLRGEIIALHEADTDYAINSARGAQLYMECVQITITGGGATALPAGVAIPGAYSATDPGNLFNLYGSFTEYTIPGPAVWDAASSGTTTPASASAAIIIASSTSVTPILFSSTIEVAAIATSVSSSSEEVLSTTFAKSVTIATTLTSIQPTTSSIAPVVVLSTATVVPVAANTSASLASSSASKSACKRKSSTATAHGAAATTSTPSLSGTNSTKSTPTGVVGSSTLSTQIVAAPITSSSTLPIFIPTSVSSAVSTPASTSSVSGAAVSEPSGTTLGDLLSWLSSFYNKYAGTAYDESTVARRHARDVAI